MVYGGSNTYTLALHREYVQSALDYLKKVRCCRENTPGFYVSNIHLDNYIKKFPDARNKVVAVKAVLAGSFAEGVIKPGDIIWEVGRKQLGGNLTILDQAMDMAIGDTIKLTIL